MAIYQAILLLALSLSTVPQPSATRTIDDEQCSPQSCSNNLPIRFPFSLKNLHTNFNCGYPNFDLSCNNMSQTIINFPYSGQFTVTTLSYARQRFKIDDPNRCLAKRLLLKKLNLTGTPFLFTGELVNYTYFNCSSKSEFKANLTSYRKLSCLSGTDYFVLGGPMELAAEVVADPPCKVVGKVLVPARAGVVDLNDGIRLGWDDFGCGFCERQGGVCGFKGFGILEVGCYNLPKSHSGLPRSAKYGLLIGGGIPVLLGLIGFGCYISGKIWAYAQPQSPNPNIGSSNTQQHNIIILGLCNKTIDSYPKTILGESKRLPKPSDDISCPICLCEYQPKETLRTIPECNHFFHAHCVDEWLRLNATCPLCRNTPDGPLQVDTPDGPSQVDTPVSSLSLPSSVSSS